MSGEGEFAKRIAVVIVDDFHLLGDALRVALGGTADIDVVALGNSCYAARAQLAIEPVHVILIGADLPAGDVIWLAREVRMRFPRTQLLLTLADVRHSSFHEFVKSGITGFLLKTQSLAEMLASIRQCAKGQPVIPAPLLPDALGWLNPSRSDYALPAIQLTHRELEILSCLSHDLSVEDIASSCHIAQLTVRTHIRNLLAKLHVHSRLEAVNYAYRHRLIQLPYSTKSN